jgi:hypothetical protein
MQTRSDACECTTLSLRLVVEHGLGYLPFTNCTINTPTGEGARALSTLLRCCGRVPSTRVPATSAVGVCL